MSDTPPIVKHHFVDEAGDGTLFDRKGRVLIGEEGGSKFFMIGLADIDNSAAMKADFDALRARLLIDPFLKKVRQFKPERKETSVYFHATVDPVEVRWEVYKILLRHEFRFTAVIKSKRRCWIMSSPATSRTRATGITRTSFTILFCGGCSRNGCISTMTTASRSPFAATKNAARNFARRLNMPAPRFCGRSRFAVEVVPAYSKDEAGLQAVDYCLWALQRVCEKPDEAGCDRYLNPLWESGKISLVVDCDDTSKASYGEYYTRKKPLLAAAFRNRG